MKIEWMFRNEDTVKDGDQAVYTVTVFDRTVKIERFYGHTTVKKSGFVGPCYITRIYEEVSLASLQRVHDAVTGLVNSGLADLHLAQIGEYGISYEAELTD